MRHPLPDGVTVTREFPNFPEPFVRYHHTMYWHVLDRARSDGVFDTMCGSHAQSHHIASTMRTPPRLARNKCTLCFQRYEALQLGTQPKLFETTYIGEPKDADTEIELAEPVRGEHESSGQHVD